MSVVYATIATWAYIHSQLDRSKQYAVHILDGDEKHTLCGREITSAWEVADIGEVGENRASLCKRCKHANGKAHAAQEGR